MADTSVDASAQVSPEAFLAVVMTMVVVLIFDYVIMHCGDREAGRQG